MVTKFCVSSLTYSSYLAMVNFSIVMGGFMNLTRRRFLRYAAAAGILTVAGGCRPQVQGMDEASLLLTNSEMDLSTKQRLAATKSQLLGYPINMNTPSEAFFAWRWQINEAGVGQFAFNNVGNPYKPSPIPFNSHDFERELI